jgi:5-(carboxyamino)imidazole ribonucleotide mutase
MPRENRIQRARFAVEGGTSGEPKSSVMDKPLVGIVMGSTSDLETMRLAATMLQELGVPFEMKVVSAHRTPDLMFRYAEGAKGRGLRAIIAGAGGAAHLPGMLATKTQLPVIGVPVESRALKGLDSLLSIAQMPAGVPVATMAIGGAANAALFAARILALTDEALAQRLDDRTTRIAREVEATVL